MSKGNVSTHALICDVSNIPDDEGPNESSLIHFHLPPTPCFEHVENIDFAISSGWTQFIQKKKVVGLHGHKRLPVIRVENS